MSGSSHITALRSAVLKLTPTTAVDKGGLSDAEYNEINTRYENPTERTTCYHTLVRPHIIQGVQLPTALYALILEYLEAPPLPPVLQQLYDMQQKIHAELDALDHQQQQQTPQLERAKSDADRAFQMKLRQRQELLERMADDIKALELARARAAQYDVDDEEGNSNGSVAMASPKREPKPEPEPELEPSQVVEEKAAH